MSNRIARLTEPTLALAHTGRRITLPPGDYRVAELDATAADGTLGKALYIYGPTGDLTALPGSTAVVALD
jgi:hypothetical protein